MKEILDFIKTHQWLMFLCFHFFACLFVLLAVVSWEQKEWIVTIVYGVLSIGYIMWAYCISSWREAIDELIRLDRGG